tara:strand:+ start:1570 stop:1953 length:384 start_codon:yes stop_codon:yes gene_type:complete
MDAIMQAFTQSFLAPVLTGIFSALATIAGVLVVKLIHKLEKKTGLDVSAAQEKALSDLAEGVIHYVEQEAARRVKVGGTSLSSTEKQTIGLKALATRAADVGITVASERLTEELEGALGKLRAKIGG